MKTQNNVWSELHQNYKDQDWIHKPSLFAETVLPYLPPAGAVLDLGAGQGQDSRFFAEHGYQVVSTDLEPAALEQSTAKLPGNLKPRVTIQQVDLRQELPFDIESFDVVYAHLSLHYFDYDTTKRVLNEIRRVLKPGGVFAFFVNSVDDPEYNTGAKLEDDYFQIGDAAKRYFSVGTVRKLTWGFDVTLLDNHGETYKDRAKGVHNLVRFIGTKQPPETFDMAIACCGAIIERTHNGETEVLMQTRWQPHADKVYSGTLEFPIGRLDKPFENIHDALAREIKEECGLTLKSISGDARSPVITSNKADGALGFRPFCCVQQLKSGKPWVGYIFICQVEPGEPRAQLSEVKDVRWMKVSEVRALYKESPERLFGLELPAWHYYFQQRTA